MVIMIPAVSVRPWGALIAFNAARHERTSSKLYVLLLCTAAYVIQVAQRLEQSISKTTYHHADTSVRNWCATLMCLLFTQPKWGLGWANFRYLMSPRPFVMMGGAAEAAENDLDLLAEGGDDGDGAPAASASDVFAESAAEDEDLQAEAAEAAGQDVNAGDDLLLSQESAESTVLMCEGCSISSKVFRPISVKLAKLPGTALRAKCGKHGTKNISSDEVMLFSFPRNPYHCCYCCTRLTACRWLAPA